MSELHIDITTSDKEIVVTRVFDAPRELVWEAFTDPKQIAQWWGPKGFTTTIEEYDLRPGGTWKHVMRGPDGAEYPNKSVFREVIKNEKIAYAHGGAKKGGPGIHFEQSWTFEVVEGNKTRLTGRQIFDSTEERETVIKVYGALEGAKGHFQCLSDHLAKIPFVIERTFDAPSDVVWKAITDPAQMKVWYFDLITDFKAEVGFETQVDVHHDGHVFEHFWKVTEVVPGKKLAYSWKYKGHVGDSLVTFELFPEGQKTRVKLTHTGLETFLPDAHPRYARSNFAKGWAMLIGSELKEFLEKN
jgi:uncharacterized protein YndB with AHSA1/START domain